MKNVGQTHMGEYHTKTQSRDSHLQAKDTLILDLRTGNNFSSLCCPVVPVTAASTDWDYPNSPILVEKRISHTMKRNREILLTNRILNLCPNQIHETPAASILTCERLNCVFSQCKVGWTHTVDASVSTGVWVFAVLPKLQLIQPFSDPLHDSFPLAGLC